MPLRLGKLDPNPEPVVQSLQAPATAGKRYPSPNSSSKQIKPRLSAYPKAAALFLVSLLDKATSVVPNEFRPTTPVRVGATAGLRALEGDSPDRILQAVRDLLKDRSSFKSDANSVTVLDGSQEGSYMWVTVNSLLGNVGRKYSDTVGVVGLGGGSEQMAYAISEEDAAKAPRMLDGKDTYVKKMYLKGRNYHLYVHRILQILRKVFIKHQLHHLAPMCMDVGV